jgi:hydroxymethylpyrimidine pyrophosphatase-like HAD family hydrolase
LDNAERKYWVNAYQNYKDNLENKAYGILILDYDGTLCSSEDRYNGINKEVSTYLNEILKKGIIIGIATGRGKSVRIDLQKVIDKNWFFDNFCGQKA